MSIATTGASLPMGMSPAALRASAFDAHNPTSYWPAIATGGPRGLSADRWLGSLPHDTAEGAVDLRYRIRDSLRERF